jgi:hypothetical protein
MYTICDRPQRRYVLSKLQRGLSATETWCERWNIKKINEDKIQVIYFSHRLRPPEAHLTLNRRSSPFVNHVKYTYLGVIFNKRITRRLHIEMIKTTVFGTFIKICPIFKSELSSANMKLSFHKVRTRSVMTYACPAWELAADT